MGEQRSPASETIVEREPSALFLSYSAADVALLQVIRARLGASLPVFFDRESLTPGLPWIDELEQALRRSAGAAIFIGKDGLGRWQQRELWLALDLQAAFERDGRRFPVIPVLLPGSNLDAAPSFLMLSTWIDLRGSLDALDRIVQSFSHPVPTPERTAAGACPYRALSSFREVDAPLFFGRSTPASPGAGDVTQLLTRRVLARPVVAVVGNSGTGKSSLVQAGLLPRLRRERPPAKSWEVIGFRPGQNPFVNLADGFLSLWDPGADPATRPARAAELGEALLKPGALEIAIGRTIAGPPPVDRLLLAVDQFEELFTLTTAQDRAPFIRALLDCVKAGHAQVVLTLRSDYLGHALGYPDLSDALQDGLVNLRNMNRAELRLAIEEPARCAGATLEPPLLERILDSLDHQPGSLPLLEFALTLLWQKQKGGVLLNQSYDDIGGVEGAISARAEEVFDGLPEAAKTPALRGLKRLARVVSATDEGSDTRQRVRLMDLDAEAASAMDVFAKERLLVLGRDEAGFEIVEVAHEALIRGGWARLTKLLDEDRQFLLWRQELASVMTQWKPESPAKGLLLRGDSLAAAQQWLRDRRIDLSRREQLFIESSATAERAATEMAARVAVSTRVVRWLQLTVAAIFIAGAGYYAWTFFDRYQLTQSLRAVERDEVAGALNNDEALRGWIEASVLARQPAEISRIARRIKTADAQARLYSNAALTFVQIKDAPQATRMLELAKTAAPWDSKRLEAMTALVKLLASTEATTGAIRETAGSFGASPHLLHHALAEGLRGTARIADFQEEKRQELAALNALQGDSRYEALNEASTLWERAGAGEEAFAMRLLVLPAIEAGKAEPRHQRLNALVFSLARAGHFNDAFPAFQKLWNGSTSSWGQEEVAGEAMAAAALRDGAYATLGSLLASSTKGGAPKFRDSLRGGAAVALAKEKKWQEANTLIETIKDGTERRLAATGVARLALAAGEAAAARRAGANFQSFGPWEISPGFRYYDLPGLFVDLGDIGGAARIAIGMDRAGNFGSASPRLTLLRHLAAVDLEEALRLAGKSDFADAPALGLMAAILVERDDETRANRFEQAARRASNMGIEPHRGFEAPMAFLFGELEAFWKKGKREEVRKRVNDFDAPSKCAAARLLMAGPPPVSSPEESLAMVNLSDAGDRACRSQLASRRAIGLAQSGDIAGARRQLDDPGFEIFPDDRSLAAAAITVELARAGRLREARILADSCSLAADQVQASTAIVLAYAKKHTPEAGPLVDKKWSGLTQPASK